MAEIKIFTSPLTASQAAALVELMKVDGFETEPRPYMICFGKKGKLSVSLYEKGPKVVIQGKDTQEFVQFRLEPEILGEAKLGYEEIHHPERYAPHFGIDESGKGDFFGPLVIAGAYVDGEVARELVEAGVADSKKITSDARIRQLAGVIRKTPKLIFECIRIGPEKYNELYRKIGNLNRLLAWGHARVIGNLLARRTDCPRALSDKFADPSLIENSLKRLGVEIELEQRTKAESDPAVAAASILARESFIDWMDEKGGQLGVDIPRGASGKVRQVASGLIDAHGVGILEEVAKTHFRTAAEVAPEHYTAKVKKPWVKR